MNSIKRKMKRVMEGSPRRISLHQTAMIIFCLSLVVFFGGQLVINAKLSPLGTELQSLNDEKNALLDENQAMEQDLANIESLSAVEHMTKKSIKLTTAKESQIVYISDNGIRAEN